MSKKVKKNETTYMYTLVCRDKDEYDKTIGDYIIASNLEDAYEMTMSVCLALNCKYGMSYTVQSIMPN